MGRATLPQLLYPEKTTGKKTSSNKYIRITYRYKSILALSNITKLDTVLKATMVDRATSLVFKL